MYVSRLLTSYMERTMSIDEEKLKALWLETPDGADSSNDLDSIDERQALNRVLKKSAETVAAKDVASLFIGWLWVVFLGFGASAFSAKRRFELHKQRSTNLAMNKPTNANKIVSNRSNNNREK